MRKGLKVLIMSLMVAVIMVFAFAGTVFAAGGPNTNPGTCPNQDCPNADCPNPDCPHNGPQYQNQFGQD